MKYKINLQLFEDGAGAGSGGQGDNAGSGNGSQSSTGKGTFSFEQAEEIASARAQRASQSALKSYFQQQGMSEEEVTKALSDYKAQKAASQPNVSAIETERDAALKELEQMKNEKVLLSKGVKSDDVDYVLFKVSKLVNDKTGFSKAAEQFLKDNPRYTGQGTYRVSTSTSASGSEGKLNDNESINAAIRLAG